MVSHRFMSLHNWFLLLVFIHYSSQLGTSVQVIKDIFVPETCENIAGAGDHLLVEFDLKTADGTSLAAVTAPDSLLYIHLSNFDVPVMKGLKGMCKNATREFQWEKALGVDFTPIFQSGASYSKMNEALFLQVRVVHLTPSKDFQIFAPLKGGNLSEVMDLIDGHNGVNAVDEWGQTPLIISLSRPRELLAVVAFLMNTRRPMVDVNMAKANGFTALFYAVEHTLPVEILKALLRRGADPNAVALSEGSRGNTPLHYACFLEKLKHAEALLEYGANPYATNEHGQNPFQLIPESSMKSSKLQFQKIFQDAAGRLSSQLGSSCTTRSGEL